jgi:hypothetical protein
MLSQLCADYFSRSPVLAWPLVALVLFMIVFVAVTVGAMFGRREVMERHAALPLQSNEVTKHE